MRYKPTTLQETRTRLPVRVLNECNGWLRQTGLLNGKLRATDLIDIAKRRCRLDDFGEGDFFEPLSCLVESSEREAGLNLVGKISFRTNLLHILRNRLLMQRDRRSYPEIAQQKIREPLFILGLPRSGTTILHTLLAADPNHRAPLTWEVMEPSPLTGQDERQRIRRTARSLSCLEWLAPTFRRVHPLGAQLPQECVALMTPSLMSDQFDTMYYIPSVPGLVFSPKFTASLRMSSAFSAASPAAPQGPPLDSEGTGPYVRPTNVALGLPGRALCSDSSSASRINRLGLEPHHYFTRGFQRHGGSHAGLERSAPILV